MEYAIAIIEDEPVEFDILKDYFKRLEESDGDIFHPYSFPSAENFLWKYNPIYDIVIMDICLPGQNGMDAAKALRDVDQNVTLIFVTNMKQYAVSGYEVNAFDYIIKPVQFSSFSLKIKRAVKQLSVRRESQIVLKYKDTIRCFSTSQIKYVEIKGHTLYFHTTKGIVEGYGTLKEIETQLNSGSFERCNSCYLVNLAFVIEVNKMYVLVDGDELLISRQRRKRFIEALNNYIGGQC